MLQTARPKGKLKGGARWRPGLRFKDPLQEAYHHPAVPKRRRGADACRPDTRFTPFPAAVSEALLGSRWAFRRSARPALKLESLARSWSRFATERRCRGHGIDCPHQRHLARIRAGRREGYPLCDHGSAVRVDGHDSSKNTWEPTTSRSRIGCVRRAAYRCTEAFGLVFDIYGASRRR